MFQLASKTTNHSCYIRYVMRKVYLVFFLSPIAEVCRGNYSVSYIRSDIGITQLLLWVLFCTLVIGFILREMWIRKRYKVLKHEIMLQREELQDQERSIRNEKKSLQEQINRFDVQNQLIHNQTIELEKDRHLLEKAVESRTRELKIAKEKAEESDRLKSAFFENVSHEIRTPMNAIMGFASLLANEDIGEEEKNKYIARISKNCQMLLGMIDDMLDMSQIQSGQMVLYKSEFSVNEVLEDLYHTYIKEMNELGFKDITLILDLDAGSKNYNLYTDRARFKQILTKLLSNAFKFTEKGTIRMGYHPLYDSDFVKDPSMLQFFVEDTGIGIPLEKSEIIFNGFSKIEDDSSKLYRGAGMGLYISKYLVNLMGGRIWFNSKMREGSTFYFTIPYFNIGETKQDKTKKEKSSKKAPAPKIDWRNKTILIVEDEENNILYLQEIIGKTGASILIAKNGRLSVDMVKDQQSISLVLMDIMLPELNGYEATRQIKSIRPSLPVIAQTAYSNAKEQKKSLEAGCDGYISKPYNPPELLSLINSFI